jgi:hypothetical protein
VMDRDGLACSGNRVVASNTRREMSSGLSELRNKSLLIGHSILTPNLFALWSHQ